MKNQKLARVLSFLISIVLCVSILAGCGAAKQQGSGTTASNEATSQASTVAASEPTLDPMAKYQPAITVMGATTAITADNPTKFAEGDSVENNPWIRGYESELGIKLKYNWVVAGSQYDQKLNISIASGEIPDIFYVNKQQYKMLLDADMITDISDVYAKFTLPEVKEQIEYDPLGYRSAEFDGKLMGWPTTGNSNESASLLWIRQDWLKKLNLEAPKTMQDLLNISKAFTENDPDGNNKKDTFGLAINKDFYSSFFSIHGFSNGYHAYPNAWIDRGDGKLVYGSIQPQMKEALKALQEMFKAGQIDPEFGIKDGGKVQESVLSDKIGIEYGQWWNPNWPLPSQNYETNKAEWVPFLPVSIDAEPAKAMISSYVSQYYVVRKGFEHPEALIKLANFNQIKNISTDPEVRKNYFAENSDNGAAQYGFLNYITYYDPRQNETKYNRIMEAEKSGGDTSKMDPDTKEQYLNNFLKMKAAHPEASKAMDCFGAEGSIKRLIDLKKGNLMMWDRFYGASTDTMTEKWQSLLKEENVVFTKIILGDSIDKFDLFVENWKKLGGDTITAELNVWYLKNK